MDKLIYELIDKEIIQIDSKFITKNINSYEDIKYFPIKIDFKNIISYNYLINNIIKLLFEKLKMIEYKNIVGISNTGKHISSILSFSYNTPLLMFSNNLMLHGSYNDYDRCVIINDTITTGENLSQYIRTISKNLLKVKDILVICDLNNHKCSSITNYNIHSLFDMYYLINLLNTGKMINNEKKLSLFQYLNTSNTSNTSNMYSLEYRKKMTSNIILKKLYDIILKKKTNLLFKCNLHDIKEIIKTVDIVGPLICILEIDSLNIVNFNTSYANALKKLARNHNFLILNDIKLSVYNSDMLWSDIVSINNINVNNIISSFKQNMQNMQNKELAFILNRETKSKDSIKISLAFKDIFVGIFSKLKYNDNSLLVINNNLIKPESDIDQIIGNGDIFCVDGNSISQNLVDFMTVYKRKLWCFY